MRLTPLLPALVAAAALGVPSAASAAQVVPGKVIVRYKGDASRHERARVQERTGTRFGTVLPGGSRTLRIDDGKSVAETVKQLNGHDGVAYAVPDYKVHAAGFVPNDPGRSGTAGGLGPLSWELARAVGGDAQAGWV